MDVAYFMSKAWINDPTTYIEDFFYLINNSVLLFDIFFFWFKIPLYYLVMLFVWVARDDFESRPTKSSLFDLYEYISTWLLFCT